MQKILPSFSFSIRIFFSATISSVLVSSARSKSFAQSKHKQVRQWGLTYIHTCQSYVHTPCIIPQTAHL